MKTPDLIILAVSLFVASHALAGDGEALAKKSNCMICHTVDGKSTGPTFKDVAAKYRNDKDAQVTLEKKVRSGGKGVWSSMPMPATTQSTSDGDIKSMVQWILSFK